MFKLLGGIFLGWSLGTNNAANIIGTAVANNIIKFKVAIMMFVSLVVVGSIAEGYKGFATLGNITHQTSTTAAIASFSAALSVTIFNYLVASPISISQSIVGAIIGIGIGNAHVNLSALPKIFISWILTPVTSAAIAYILYILFKIFLKKYSKNQIIFDKFIIVGFYIICGYGAYAFGADNVANITGIYVTSGMLTPFMGALIGGLAIAFGVLTANKKVIMTVGKNLVPLDYYSAFVAILAEAIAVHIFAIVGVPVSSSQAIIGGVLGVGLVTGTRTINKKTLRNIIIGWVGGPTIAGFMSFGFYELIKIL